MLAPSSGSNLDRGRISHGIETNDNVPEPISSPDLVREGGVEKVTANRLALKKPQTSRDASGLAVCRTSAVTNLNTLRVLKDLAAYCFSYWKY